MADEPHTAHIAQLQANLAAHRKRKGKMPADQHAKETRRLDAAIRHHAEARAMPGHHPKDPE